MAFVTAVHVQAGILNSGLGVRARPTVVSDLDFLNFIITFEHFKNSIFFFQDCGQENLHTPVVS